MRTLVAILALALLIGIVGAFDPIATMNAMSSQSQPSGASAPVIAAPTQTPPAILSQNTAPSLLPSTPSPTAMPTVVPTQTVSPVVSPKLSDIQGEPIALQMAGVNFDGSKADQNRYDSAVATDYLGNPIMVADGFALPYTMSKDAVPYHSVFAPSKQSEYALTHGKAVYTNPDGSTTSVPLLLVVDDQPAFHLWYKSTYSDPFVVLG